MTRFEKWFLRGVFRHEVVQGPRHAQNISDLYGMIQDAAMKEFREDNLVTIEGFLRERLEEAFKQERERIGGWAIQDTRSSNAADAVT